MTGAAGFIGHAVCLRLLADGYAVVGVDSLNDYYDVSLKQARLRLIVDDPNFTFVQADVAEHSEIFEVFEQGSPSHVIHLAAQAGVRYSLENPNAYLQSNLIGFFNILECCRHFGIEHLVYASSSSVYGRNVKTPFEEGDRVDCPVSLYAATKRSNELLAYAYSCSHSLPATGLRFFTVYGPLGRPDMAYFGFTDRYFAGKPITIFNNGDVIQDLYRDFTYIDDVVDGVVAVSTHIPGGEVPHALFNIGNESPVRLMDFIATLEKALSNSLGRPIEFDKVFEGLVAGDVPATYASTDKLEQAVGFRPTTPLAEGLRRFTDWYVAYNGVS
ncbi:NAD-dependent epimerase/dehydratase family protein [Knoellia sp. S7-12]|uniref:NAD-dependent epimerase/dehydratase family protein n=1 Tax=Knoellia sp. S7-12 TaxID=3126698 RepID=UPI0033673ECC